VKPSTPASLAGRTLWLIIALAMIAAGCASVSTSIGEPDAAVATAAAALEDAAEAAVGDSATNTPSTAVPDSEPDASDDAADTDAASGDPTVAADPDLDEATSTNELGNEFSDTELPPAPIGFEALTPEPGGRQPVSMVIEDIDVVDATIIPVGVNPDQTFEVPPADQVGWYRFGPTPGEEGSAVLAAHIAFDGVDGVFRHLADVEVGAVVVVGYDDGTSQRYRIDSVTDYFKEELPPELFARDGDSQLALITCGGTFNPQLRSYESNTVAVATPI
jgi:LPXTG-site transpeptidase (sortase) family protein